MSYIQACETFQKIGFSEVNLCYAMTLFNRCSVEERITLLNNTLKQNHSFVQNVLLQYENRPQELELLLSSPMLKIEYEMIKEKEQLYVK